jgi:hypothetical protein
VSLNPAPQDTVVRGARHDQHASHRKLLTWHPPPRGTARIDAVIVPAARRVSGLNAAIDLARKVDCPVVVLCSQDAEVSAINGPPDDPGRVIPLDAGTTSMLPYLRTTDLVRRSPFARHSDTSAKRNLGLALSRMAGWQRVLFLDDDITGISADRLREAAAHLGPYDAVGLDNIGFSDNSVVCHANRDTGEVQGTFVGAGALLVPAATTTSFFPDIYNEDWLFLLDGDRLMRTAVSGAFEQARYDPYKNPSRARSEEFGDCLAEGIFTLLDQGRTVGAATITFWREFLGHRGALIETIIQKAATAPVTELRRLRMIAALRASQESLAQITPDFCVKYLRAWHRDRRDWSRWVEGLPTDQPLAQSLRYLGFKV